MAKEIVAILPTGRNRATGGSPTAKAEKCVSAAEEAKLPRTRYGCLKTEECHNGRPGEYPPAPLTCCDHSDYKFGRMPDGECYPAKSASLCDGEWS